MIILYVGTHNLVEIRNLKSAATGQYVSDAECKMTVVDEQSVNVTGAIDIPLALINGSSGHYAGMIPSNASLSAGTKYFLQITTTTGGLVRLDRIPVRAQYAEGV